MASAKAPMPWTFFSQAAGTRDTSHVREMSVERISLGLRRPSKREHGWAPPGGGADVISIAVGARPDQLEGMFPFNFGKCCINRGRETWVVELYREVVSALLGRLLPRGAELHVAGIDAKVRAPVGRIVDTRDASLDIEGESSDRAIETVFDGDEVADGCHCHVPFAGSSRTIVARWRLKTGDDRARIRRTEMKWRADKTIFCCCARNVAKPQGKKISFCRCGRTIKARPTLRSESLIELTGGAALPEARDLAMMLPRRLIFIG